MDAFKDSVKKRLGSRSTRFLEIYYFIRFLFHIGSARKCPCCDSNVRYFLPTKIGAKENTPEIRCPRCDSHPRHRLLWLYLRELRETFFCDTLSFLILAPEFCFLRRFKLMKNLRYVTGDMDSPLADTRLDVTSLPFSDNTFDVIFCNHVLEHVVDDLQAMRELHRVMKPQGWGVLQVPINMELKTTHEDLTITSPDDRILHYGQADHVRQYGADYTDRLKAAGFIVDMVDYAGRFEKDRLESFGLQKGEPLFLCIKPKCGSTSGDEVA